MTTTSDRDEAVQLERMLIHERAGERHDEMCSKGADCSNRAWHIANDYLRRAQKDRVNELEAQVAAARAALENTPGV